MKNIIILILFTLNAQAFSIHPEKTTIPMVELFENYITYTNGTVKVKGVSLVEGRNREDNVYTEKGKSHIIEESEFDFMRKHGFSVFETNPGDKRNHFGTSFHVGANLVLTNQHVLSVSRDNTTECYGFKLKLNYNQYNKTLYCKEVHYCDRGRDFCLIEMYPARRGQALEKQEPLVLNPNIEFTKDTEHYAIGNTRGFGIHGSKGKGLKFENFNSFKFYAAVFGGNSGGPVLNSKGEVIGLVKMQSKELNSLDSYNIGISIKEVLTQLEINLAHKPEVLEQLNIKKEETQELEIEQEDLVDTEVSTSNDAQEVSP